MALIPRGHVLMIWLTLLLWMCVVLAADGNDTVLPNDPLPAEPVPESSDPTKVHDTGFFPSTLQAFVMILMSEIGDNTFFISAILAMKHSKLLVFLGSLLAATFTTVLAVVVGNLFPLLINKRITSIIAGLLFLYFGMAMLYDYFSPGSESDSESESELREAEEQVALEEQTLRSESEPLLPGNLQQSSSGSNTKIWTPIASIMSPIFVRSFTLTFFGEWGDRSQIATIAFAASKNPYGVVLGCILGHASCLVLAVVGGRMVASRISERLVTLMGGIGFLVFAALLLFNVDLF